MPTDEQRPQYTLLHAEGLELRAEIDEHLRTWPTERNNPLRGDHLPAQFAARTEYLADRVARWLNRLAIDVLPFTAYDRPYLTTILHNVSAGVRCMRFYAEYRPAPPPPDRSFRMFGHSHPEFNTEHPTDPERARAAALEGIDAALHVVRTAHNGPSRPQPVPRSGFVPNTAFILMWMDKTRPELVDVHATVKETFAEFDIHAVRADEVEHQDRITDLVLDQISQSEFLFADLSGQRPNVYYEVGFAHALGKRPILFRREGTPLHFDLSVHNVPEYKNITELRSLLRTRLAAITGKVRT